MPIDSRVRHIAWIAIAAAVLMVLPANADPIKFARYPHSHGDQIAFSYHGDIWVADADGNNARRLTAHIANDTFPRFSPDGQWIAFTSNRMGNNDVFVVPTAGGVPRQLTYHSTGDTVLNWMPDGERILFSTSRGAHPFYSPLYAVHVGGGLPMPLAMDQGAAGMVSPDGSQVAFNRYGMRYWRKGYRGNSQTDIWLQDLPDGEIRQLTDADTENFRAHTQDAYPMWGADGMVYFMSERDGLFNIWKVAPDGSGIEQVTDHGSDGVQYPSISPDGATITYENEFEVWKLSVPNGTPERVVINLDFDPKENLVEFLHIDSEADGFSPSPDGRYLAVDSHGEIFIVPTDPEVGEKKQVTSNAWRQRSAVWSPDGDKLLYISDESGDQEIWYYEVATGAQGRITSIEAEKGRIVWAPDSLRFAFAAANQLWVGQFEENADGEIDSFNYVQMGDNLERGFQIGNFSADGTWLVYSRRNEDLDDEVYMRRVFPAEGEMVVAPEEVNLTQDPFRDTAGLITPDGGHVVFRSNRGDGTYQLYTVALSRLTEDPDDPLVRERNLMADEPRGRGDADADDTPATITDVDTDGIQRRARQLTSSNDSVGSFFLSNDGDTVYYIGTDQRGRAMFSIPIEGGEANRMASGAFPGLAVTGDGSGVFFRQNGNVMHMPLRGGNLDNQKEQVDFDFTVVVDQRSEWRQIFDEAWRVMKYRFYDPDMHGVDWSSVRERYEELLQYVGQNQDLYDLTNEMIGELNASHTGVSGPPSIDMPDTYTTAELGFEMEVGDRYTVGHIYDNGPADKEWLDIEAGDAVVAIDGTAVRPPENFWQLLNHTLNDYVTVTLDRGGNEHDVRIRTVNSLRNIKYEEWVEANRRYVEEVSNGQIAYVHIRAMNQPSLRRFENEINRFWNAKGIVVDIRYNGGGNIDQQLLDILERRPYEYWNNRYASEQSGRRPRQAIAGPKVMLINRRSGSDSEVTPMGFRDLGLGSIVGNPTAGAVIATGSYSLINGGRIRTPGSLVVTYDPSQPGNRGINLENYGVAPDVWVENSPQDELDGFDRELKAATDEALRMLASGEWQYSGSQRPRR